METEAASSIPWEFVGTAATSLLGVVALWLKRARSTHVRDEVEQDQRILANLHEESTMRTVLQESIDTRVRRLAASTDKASRAKRDPFGVGLAIFFLALAVAFGWWAVQGGWWLLLWLPAAFFALLGLVGLYQDGRKVLRDGEGNEITKPRTSRKKRAGRF
ncbi:hypothetical protein [Promicromonospora sp. NPDC059942]|uniref:hypothetical protein n=1 Tax=Promicromonospora sp. NPDC059942 TaxID=3347009 RepID=UPI0036470F82